MCASLCVRVCVGAPEASSGGVCARAQSVELEKRRFAKRLSRGVENFWLKIDKLAVYKHRALLEAKYRRAMDK